MYIGSHRRWLRRFGASILHKALDAIADDEFRESQKEAITRDQKKSREYIRTIRHKPAWALTACEAETVEDVENEELINFASSLDFETEMKQVEEMVQQVETMHQSEEDVEIPPQHPKPVEAKYSSNPLESARIFNFDSASLINQEPPEEEDVGTLLPERTERIIVISDDVKRIRTETFSNMPYLRLCPFV